MTVPQRRPVPGDLDAVLDGVARAHPELERAVSAALSSWRERMTATLAADGSWGFSPLTGDGWPLEMVLGLGEPAVRWTAEVAGPTVAPRARLAAGAELTRTPAAVLASLAALQGGELGYGAWLGERHDRNGRAHKLYAEVGDPAAAQRLCAEVLGPQPVLTTRAPTCRIVAYRPGDGAWEVYYRLERLAGWELERIATRAGQPGAGRVLLDFITEVIDRRPEGHLPGLQHGFSLAQVGGTSLVMTVFLFARVLGSDARIRAQLLSVARAHGWDAEAYQVLSAGSSRRTGADTDHGMLGFSIAAGRAPRLTVGLRVRREADR